MLQNLLPYDGEVFYIPEVFTEEEANQYISRLWDELNWQKDIVNLFGKTHIMNRSYAWVGAQPFSYNYSGKQRIAESYSTSIKEILYRIESVTKESYNACLLNYYPTGLDGMGWHTDNEQEMVGNSSIASISFGEERRFQFRHQQTNETITIQLQNGSLLEMKGTTQQHWKHQLPKTKRTIKPRMNLTFRKMK